LKSLKDESYLLGKSWGFEAANYALQNYKEVIEGAENYADLNDLMSDFWSDFMKQTGHSIEAYSIPDVKLGWYEGFYDVVFPLRKYA
jgi:hypothetical protein